MHKKIPEATTSHEQLDRIPVEESFVVSAEKVGDIEGCNIFEVETHDPMLDLMPDERSRVDEFVRKAIEDTEYIQHRPHFAPKGDVEDIMDSNIASKRFFHREEMSTIRAWRRQVPTALALYPLQNPNTNYLLDENKTPMREEDRPYFIYTLDAVGLRSRATVMAEVLKNRLSEQEDQRWLSLASGAADPVFKAAAGLNKNHIEVDLVDIDSQALTFAETLKGHHGFNGQLRAHEGNLFNHEGVVETLQTSRGQAKEAYDFVDILGFFEYLQDQDIVDSSGDVLIPSCSSFLQQAFEFVKPGGTLVLGNMLDTHPQLPFTMNVVHWPYIQPRSLERIHSLIQAANIDEESVDYYVPSDGVYAVAAITKS